MALAMVGFDFGAVSCKYSGVLVTAEAVSLVDCSV